MDTYKLISPLLPDFSFFREMWPEVFCCFSFRDHPKAFFKKPQVGDTDMLLVLPKSGNVWDIGCNVGFYTLWMARAGCNVLAVDISNKALSLLRKGAQKSGLIDNILLCCGAVACKRYLYKMPDNARLGNSVMNGDGCIEQSLLWSSLKTILMPSFIKMDIEGEELEFLQDQAFLEFLKYNKIKLLVETHSVASEKAVEELLHKGFTIQYVAPTEYLVLP